MTSPTSSAAIPEQRLPGLISPIGVFFIILGAALVAASLLRAEIRELRLTPWDATGPVLMITAGVGAIFRKPWGRWLSYLISLLLLPGVPIGTIFGGYMIYHLTIYRDQFRDTSKDQNRVP